MNAWDVVCAFDWITPAKAFLDDARFGPPADFGAVAGVGWFGKDIRDLLSRYGIRVWGLIYSGDVLMFAVPKSQAKWAYHILQQADVPLRYVPQAASDEDGTTTHHYSFWDALFGRIPKE